MKKEATISCLVSLPSVTVGRGHVYPGDGGGRPRGARGGGHLQRDLGRGYKFRCRAVCNRSSNKMGSLKNSLHAGRVRRGRQPTALLDPRPVCAHHNLHVSGILPFFPNGSFTHPPKSYSLMPERGDVNGHWSVPKHPWSQAKAVACTGLQATTCPG